MSQTTFDRLVKSRIATRHFALLDTSEPSLPVLWHGRRLIGFTRGTALLTTCERMSTMKERCQQVALDNTPGNVRVIRPRSSLSGIAYCKAKCGSWRGLMCAPRPFTRRSLYIFLHECAHFVLHSEQSKPRYVEEYEAEQWAHAKMREAGLAVPRCETRRAKQYVARKLRRVRRRKGRRLDPRILAYAR